MAGEGKEQLHTKKDVFLKPFQQKGKRLHNIAIFEKEQF